MPDLSAAHTASHGAQRRKRNASGGPGAPGEPPTAGQSTLRFGRTLRFREAALEDWLNELEKPDRRSGSPLPSAPAAYEDAE